MTSVKSFPVESHSPLVLHAGTVTAMEANSGATGLGSQPTPSMKHIPIFSPTLEEFNDFARFIGAALPFRRDSTAELIVSLNRGEVQ